MNSLIKKDKRVKEEIKEIKNKIKVNPEVIDESLEKIAALKIFMLDWAKAEGLPGIAIKRATKYIPGFKAGSCPAN